ncbi:hypothetical protein UFOVP296_36 [uncultured Caudovirales phage]|uniref:Uncharacterized protein n=1 Tax=uncultured Caudovirales phage TaxID=2100421 RepID=A0A6J5PDD1_9CAUD|nr:hypothetical protein UFOVP296_36 [uncultured Caudovirales phage]CAB4169859.1 hypothetical protein UFOVP912_11 [uncultured Caudovirales phage]CAB4199466.1 hypothetical protein UFOVP1334_43 [uncultured Caudovirales phage]
MTSAVGKIKKLYESHEIDGSLTEDVRAHMETGCVFSGPDFFLVGRPVDSSASIELIGNPKHTFPQETCDAWYVWLGAGDAKSLMELAPYRLPLVGFARRGGRLRWHSWDRLQAALSLDERRKKT